MEANLDPSKVSEMDQAFAGLAETAKVMGQYRKKLLDEGFSSKTAERMCVDFNAIYWSQQALGGQEEE